MVKFKVTFTVNTAGFIKIVPELRFVDNLQIEEIISAPNVPHVRPQFKKPRAHGKYAKRAATPMDLTRGVNKIIMDVLNDGPHKATEIKKAMKTTDYSPNSIGSRLQNLEKNGVVVRMGDGKWILSKTYKEMQKIVVDHHRGGSDE